MLLEIIMTLCLYENMRYQNIGIIRVYMVYPAL